MTRNASAEVLPHLLQKAFPLHWGDASVQDIYVNGDGSYWVRTSAGKVEVGSPHVTTRAVRAIATHAAQLRGQRFDEATPLLDAELPGGERIAAVMHPCTPGECPLLAIRRGSQEVPTLEELEAQGVFSLFRDIHYDAGSYTSHIRAEMERMRGDGDIMKLLEFAMFTNRTVGFVGATSSGKTHNMKALWSAMPRTRRTLFVGDVNEVPKGLPLLDYGIMLAGKHGEIPQSKLIAQTLRMGPELLCVLETRDGDAAWALYRALASGHQGMTSWHAPSARDSFATLAAMMRESQSAQGMTTADIIERLRVMFHFVCSVARQADGTFRVTDVLFGDELHA